jgi:peptidoglycan hydrolase CwlO-like protein
MNIDRKTLKRTADSSTLGYRIFDKLDWLIKYFGNELGRKQQIIQQMETEVQGLNKIIKQKDAVIFQLEQKLKECVDNQEANRQLINKLVGEISHYENDIEWYKRTYENRSILGLFKQRLFK